MNNLMEEFNSYQELTNMKDKINKELLELSGKNDSSNVQKMNELAAKLGNINGELSKYNSSSLEKISAYFKTKEDFDKVCKNIKAIEDLSKKSTGKKEIIISAEGRKKNIDEELSEDYKLLVEQKKKLRINFDKNYRDIKEIASIINNNKLDNTSKTVAEEVKYVFPRLTTYDDLSIADKIKETEERLERIFASSLLPNQGKKITVTYDGKKHTIPSKYQGYYKDTLKELNILKKKNEKTVEESNLQKVNIERIYNKAASFSDSNTIENTIQNSNFIPNNQETNFQFQTPEDQDRFYELFGDCPEYKKQEIYERLFSEDAINRRNSLIGDLTRQEQEEPKFRQKINTAKSYVTSVPRKIKNLIVTIGFHLKQKKNELEYEVVNRAVNIKDSTCQKVSEVKSKICDISRENLDNLKYVFNDIKKDMQTRKEKRKYSKDELFEIIQKLQEENLRKDEEISLYKMRIKQIEGNSRGYVATGILTVIGVIAMATVIFIIVSNIVTG